MPPPVPGSAPASVPVLHAVTSAALLADPAFPARAALVMGALGPRGAVHLRDGGLLPARRLLDLALRLAEVQAASGCWLVVNDRVDVAVAAGARAVQLTSRSMEPPDARRAAATRPALLVGASVHAADEARRRAAAGADWVVAGHVYETGSHPGAPGRGIALVHEVAAAAARVPVIAIGGVTPARVPLLRAAGAHGVAVIRGVWGAPDAARAAVDYLAAYDADGASGRRDDAPDGERGAALGG